VRVDAKGLADVMERLDDSRVPDVARPRDPDRESNFPIEIFDRTDGEGPRRPTFGIKIMPALPGADAQLFPPLALPLLWPVRQLEQVLATAMVGHDQSYIERPGVRRRMIAVDTSSIGITEFDADLDKRERAAEQGRAAAEEFLADWDWDRYRYRTLDPRSADED
jgi:NTE family protein